MKIVVAVVACLVIIVVGIALVGWSLPVRHRATRSAAFPVEPDRIHALLTDFASYPTWRTGVKGVDLVDLPGGGHGYRERGADGEVLFAVEETVPGRRLVTRIADNTLPYAGTWTFELTPAPPPASGSTVLRITEDGEVFNPFFRFASKFVFSHHATIDAFLSDLGRKLGVAPVISP